MLKAWLTAFILFIFISFIIPGKRPFVDGEVYINSSVYAKKDLNTNKPHLILDQEGSKHFLQKVENWRHHHSLKQIVFIVPRYEVLIYYFYLKHQRIIQQQDYKLSTINEVFNLPRIVIKFHEAIGVLLEYMIDSILGYIRGITNKVVKTSKI